MVPSVDVEVILQMQSINRLIHFINNCTCDLATCDVSSMIS